MPLANGILRLENFLPALSSFHLGDALNHRSGFTALIPLRAGSKSIPKKNIFPFQNKPLAYWALKAAIECPEIDRVVVATNGEEIERELRAHLEHPKFEIIGRSDESASETAPTETVLMEFAQNHDFSNLVLIQATSPLLSALDLRGGIEKFKQGGYTSLLSVVPQRRFIWTEYGDVAMPMNYRPDCRPRRQEHEVVFIENGAFYISSREAILSSKCRISGRVGLYPMRPETYFEIDEPEDLRVVEKLFQRPDAT